MIPDTSSTILLHIGWRDVHPILGWVTESGMTFPVIADAETQAMVEEEIRAGKDQDQFFYIEPNGTMRDVGSGFPVGNVLEAMSDA